MSDETAGERTKWLARAAADSRQPCDCVDCDGRWCVWCFTHHGRKACPLVEELELERDGDDMSDDQLSMWDDRPIDQIEDLREGRHRRAGKENKIECEAVAPCERCEVPLTNKSSIEGRCGPCFRGRAMGLMGYG